MENRSYSRNSRCTSEESEIIKPLFARASISPTRRSCASSRNENSRQTAQDSAPDSVTAATACCNEASSSGVTILRAVGDPFVDLETPMARSQRLRMVDLKGVEMRPRLAADLQQIAKSARGDDGDAWRPCVGSSALVATVVPWQSRETPLASMPKIWHNSPQAIGDRRRRIMRRRGRLEQTGDAVACVVGKEIGKRAADVDAYQPAHCGRFQIAVLYNEYNNRCRNGRGGSRPRPSTISRGLR